MDSPYLTIIIPVYNTEKYLKKCLDSVISQAIKNIEIICIDDGSTDNSPAILDEYAKRDDRIKVIHKTNGGLVSVRKHGVVEAKGKYIGFVDSDDWVEPDMFERLYNTAIKYNADMVSSGYIMEGGYVSYEYDSLEEGLYVEADKCKWLDKIIFNMSEHDLGLRGSVCCKLFRGDLLKKIQPRVPDEITISEDKMCVLTFALECKSMYVIRDAWYHYMINSGSMTQKPNTDYLIKVNAVYRYLTSLYQNNNFSEEMRKQAEIYVTQLLIKGINSRMGFSVKNLMWIDSEWMYEVPMDSRILLCGGGGLGAAYERQIKNNKRLVFAGYYDSSLEMPEYDFVVITVKYKPRAEELKRKMTEQGILEEKILWFEQKEIFWKYAIDAGLA